MPAVDQSLANQTDHVIHRFFLTRKHSHKLIYNKLLPSKKSSKEAVIDLCFLAFENEFLLIFINFWSKICCFLLTQLDLSDRGGAWWPVTLGKNHFIWWWWLYNASRTHQGWNRGIDCRVEGQYCSNITWLTPWAGKMNQIVNYDWLP